jgi:hypothetical protein
MRGVESNVFQVFLSFLEFSVHVLCLLCTAVPLAFTVSPCVGM